MQVAEFYIIYHPMIVCTSPRSLMLYFGLSAFFRVLSLVRQLKTKKNVNIIIYYCNFSIHYMLYKNTWIFVHLYEVKANKKSYNVLIPQLL